MKGARQPYVYAMDVTCKSKDWQKGTTLSELLISITLFLFLILIVSRFMLTMHKKGAQLQSTLNGTHALFAAVELLKRDMWSASHTIDSWVLQTPSPIWLMNKNHIQWYLKEGALIRRTGAYCKKLQKWKKHTNSLIARGVDRFALEPHQNELGNITTVSYIISIKQRALSGIIYVKNRDIA